MPAKAVQISLDEDLLRVIDSDPEAQRAGRSAFIRRAVSAYLEAKRRRDVDEAFRRAYQGKADELLDDIRDLIGGQAWPRK
jgi:metal-responsive CopG/Arc/MetJ family transcriptional regulator